MTTNRPLRRAACCALLVASGLGNRTADAAPPAPAPPYMDPAPPILAEIPGTPVVDVDAPRDAAVDYFPAPAPELVHPDPSALVTVARQPELTRAGYPPLTPAGLAAMITCESGGHGRHAANTGNGFRGAVQWLQATWDAAAARAGYPGWVGVRVDLVPADVQDAVTVDWWARSNPAQQWPVCHRAALRAMT